MLDLFKKKVTNEEYGHQMWLFCCDSTKAFCLNFRPKLQAEGFLKNPIADRKFMDEAMLLHLWILSHALGIENRKILDVLHNFAMAFIVEQQGKQVSITDRYELYDQATSKDMELQNKQPTPTMLAKTAFKCLVNNKNSDINFFILTELHLTLYSTIRVVRKLRGDVKIRG
jgi:hypothetical protein